MDWVVVGGLAVKFLSAKKPLLSACRLRLGCLPHAMVPGGRWHMDTQDSIFLKRKQYFGGILAQDNACIGNRISQCNSRFLTRGDNNLHCKGSWYLLQHVQLDQETTLTSVLISSYNPAGHTTIWSAQHIHNPSWLHTQDCSLRQFLQEQFLLSVYTHFLYVKFHHF